MTRVAKEYAALRAEMNIRPENTSWEDAITQHRDREWHASRVRERDKRGEAMKRKGGWHKKVIAKRKN